jgi:iron complex outermembrane receptor protein
MTAIQYQESRGQFPVRSRTIASLCCACALALFLGVNPARAQGVSPPPAQEKSPAPAQGQTATQPSVEGPVVAMEQYVVTGVRGSLINAEEIKLNSPDFVDSVIAQDIGKLPDITVADALQRIPGVQVGRGLEEGELGRDPRSAEHRRHGQWL